MILKTCNDLELKKICKHVQNEGYKIFYEQEFTSKELATFFKRIGICETPNLFMNHKDNPEIFNVSGEKDSKGNKIGMFGDGELGWHSNGNSRHLIDKILIGLYCVNGNPNTTLSVTNTSKPYYEMIQGTREYYKNIKIRLKFQNDTMYHLEEDDPEFEFMSKNKGSIRPLIDEHPHTGLKYFYFPYHFIIGAWEGKKKIDHEKLIEELKPQIFKSKYMTHHILQEGDLLLMDQLISLHRRTPVMGPRLLWRVASDYSQI